MIFLTAAQAAAVATVSDQATRNAVMTTLNSVGNAAFQGRSSLPFAAAPDVDPAEYMKSLQALGFNVSTGGSTWTVSW